MLLDYHSLLTVTDVLEHEAIYTSYRVVSRRAWNNGKGQKGSVRQVLSRKAWKVQDLFLAGESAGYLLKR